MCSHGENICHGVIWVSQWLLIYPSFPHHTRLNHSHSNEPNLRAVARADGLDNGPVLAANKVGRAVCERSGRFEIPHAC